MYDELNPVDIEALFDDEDGRSIEIKVKLTGNVLCNYEVIQKMLRDFNMPEGQLNKYIAAIGVQHTFEHLKFSLEKIAPLMKFFKSTGWTNGVDFQAFASKSSEMYDKCADEIRGFCDDKDEFIEMMTKNLKKQVELSKREPEQEYIQ